MKLVTYTYEMAKFVSTIILVVVIITVQGITYDEILSAAKKGQWDQVHDISLSSESMDETDLQSSFGKDAIVKPEAFNSVRNLKPPQGGQVYGEAEYSFHSASNVNGKTSEDIGGHKIINNNGKVNEFDFTPSTRISPMSVVSPNPGLQDSQSAGAHPNIDYALHSASALGELSNGFNNNANQQFDLGSTQKLADNNDDVYYVIETGSDIEDKPPEKIIENNERNKPTTENSLITSTRVRNPFGDFYYEVQSASAMEDKTPDKASDANWRPRGFDQNERNKLNDRKPSNVKKSTASPISFTGVRNLRPSPNGHVYGEAAYAYHSSSNIDGKTSEQHGGHKVINHDGKVKEFDFKPSLQETNLAPLSLTNVRDLKPSQGGHVYGEAEYTYHSASNVNGKTSEDHGGHKIINHDGKVKEFDFTPSPDSSPLKKLPLSILDQDIGALKKLFMN